MLYSYRGGYPQENLPERIRLSDGRTKTNSSTYTNEEIVDAGYVAVSTAPTYNDRTHKLSWNGTDWQVDELTEEEITRNTILKWEEIREERDKIIHSIEWKIMRNLSETRLGITTTTDVLSDLDSYLNTLRNITTQEDPYNIVWPNYVDSRDESESKSGD
tara:strand:+ start:295 stop:774 length:480 start_codon:yes stop_codon:yes gene_type:complete